MKRGISKSLALLGAFFIYMYGLALRVRLISMNERTCHERAGSNNVIYAHWHQDTIPWASTFSTKNKKMCTMASLSKDGEIITLLLHYLNFKVARGSQGKRGKTALEEMLPWVSTGTCNAALAVDGSRGPKYKVKMGALILARDTGKPIIVGGIDYKYKMTFNSWDKMYLPCPFSKGVAFYSNPIYVPKNITDEELEMKRLEVENTLLMLKKKAEAYFS